MCSIPYKIITKSSCPHSKNAWRLNFGIVQLGWCHNSGWQFQWFYFIFTKCAEQKCKTIMNKHYTFIQTERKCELFVMVKLKFKSSLNNPFQNFPWIFMVIGTHKSCQNIMRSTGVIEKHHGAGCGSATCDSVWLSVNSAEKELSWDSSDFPIGFCSDG